MSDVISKVEDDVEFDEDIFDSMVYGTFEPEEVADEDETADNEEDTDDVASDDDEDQEDTDQEEELEDEDEPGEDSDGYVDEESEDEDDDEEEDSLVEDDSSDDEDDDTEEDGDEADEAEDPADEDIDDESEDEAETEEQMDADAKDTDGIDYKAFYDSVVNTEFVVNGKKVKGFSDPKKIIQAQQMSGGFSEKMAGFKKYRPFMSPLKDRGMLDDPAKFDLAMNLIDGDVEAIKQHLKTLEVDPMDLDMETIQYTPKASTASKEELVIEDVLDQAKSSGIEDRVRQIIGKEWDAESFQEFVDNDAVRADLLNHIETGAYDRVQDKMSEMSRLDYNGAYGNLSTINKYRAAVVELQKEAPAVKQDAEETVSTATKPAKKVAKKSTVKSEKAKIEKAREEEEYKRKAADREAKLTQQRKKAASMSRKKAKAAPKPKFDPLAVEGEDLDELMELLISGGRE